MTEADVEKVARAMRFSARPDGVEYENTDETWAKLGPCARAYWIGFARAALEASPLATLEAENKRLTSDCKFLLAVIDTSNEAEAPPSESDPDDLALIAAIRRSLTPQESTNNGR